jgi:hypothetical protein
MIFNTDGQYFPKQCQWIGFCNGTLLIMCEVGTEFLGYFSCIEKYKEACDISFLSVFRP